MYVEEVIAQKAVEETGFGSFNIKIMVVGALIYLNCAFCITSVGFVIPTAACDFQMTTIDKGRINAAPMLGMVIGSGFWGYLADLKGRRVSLLISLLLQFGADALCSIVPSYSIFVILKVISGMGVSGQLTILFPYIGEFQPTKRRHQILSCMEFFWAIGVIVVAMFAWAIIPLDIHYDLNQYYSIDFTFNSWNLYVLLSSLPALGVALWLAVLPETPKFLAENAQLDTLITVLTQMFKENIGGHEEDFRERLAAHSCPMVRTLVDPCTVSNAKEKLAKRNRFREMLNSSKAQVRTLLRKPYSSRLCITSVIIFCMTSTYYSLMTWFPELFQRFAAFERHAPGRHASVCTVSDQLTAFNSSELFGGKEIDPFGCGSQLDTSVYVNSAWLGVACLPFAVLLPLTVNKVGYRIYLLLTSTIACVVTVLMYYVQTSLQNIILSCIFEAFTSLNVSVVLCLLVDLFPTNLRVMASAIVLFVGRLGSVFGNTLFGYLIDHYCDVLIIAMAAQLFIASCMCYVTPTKNKLRRIQGHPKAVEKKGSDPL